MRVRPIVQIALVLVVTAAAVATAPRIASAVFASPINAGCYIIAPNQCRIHIEPVTVNIAAGKRLVALKLQLNGATIYDFGTDVSNPPPSVGTTYTPSPVALDFGAVCGTTYTINILGKDTGDANFLNMGLASFTCPDKRALKPPKQR